MYKVEINRKNFYDLLKNNKLNISKLSRQTNLSRVFISRVINGKQGLGNNFIAEMLVRFNCKFDDLFILTNVLTNTNINITQKEE